MRKAAGWSCILAGGVVAVLSLAFAGERSSSISGEGFGAFIRAFAFTA